MKINTIMPVVHSRTPVSNWHRPLRSCLLALAVILSLGFVQEAQATICSGWDKPGQEVLKEIQTNLRFLRLYSGAINGSWDQRTISAVQQAVAQWAGYQGRTDGSLAGSGATTCRSVQDYARVCGGGNLYIGIAGATNWRGFRDALVRQRMRWCVYKNTSLIGPISRDAPQEQSPFEQDMDSLEQDVDLPQEPEPTESTADMPEADTPGNAALSEDNDGLSTGCNAVGGPFSLAALISLVALVVGRRKLHLPALRALPALAVILGLGFVQEAQAAECTSWNQPSAAVQKDI